MSPIEISIIACTVAFILLVVYLITVLVSVKATLSHVNQTLDCLQKDLTTCHEISTDIQGKLKKIDPFFHAAFLWGESIEQRQRYKAEAQETRTAELLQWAVLGADLWQKFTRR